MRIVHATSRPVDEPGELCLPAHLPPRVESGHGPRVCDLGVSKAAACVWLAEATKVSSSGGNDRPNSLRPVLRADGLVGTHELLPDWLFVVLGFIYEPLLWFLSDAPDSVTARGIVESCGQVKKGKRRRILLLENFLSRPTTGKERIRHHATRYEQRHDKSSKDEGTWFGFGYPGGSAFPG